MENHANKLFDEAIEKLNEASEELFRPEEDVVAYLVCKNSQYAIENYLKGYLLQNGIDPSSSKTINALYKRCLLVNKKFKKVDLKGFDCKPHKMDTRYCNDVSKVGNCFDIASRLDTFLKKEKIIS